MAVTLGSLAVEVNARLGNRRDVLTYTTFPTVANMQDTDRLANWMQEAYNEICLGYRFEELCQAYTDQMTAGVDIYQLPQNTTRFIRAVTLLFPQGTSQQPRPLRRRHIRNIRRYQTFSPGPPAIYAPYNPGGQASIIVRPVPDLGYQFVWDIQSKPTYGNAVGQTISSATVTLPDDWLGVLKGLIQLKGHAALGEHDKVQALQMYLFGGYDPGLGRRVPGIIRQLVDARDKLDIEDTEYGLQPQLRRFTNSI